MNKKQNKNTFFFCFYHDMYVSYILYRYIQSPLNQEGASYYFITTLFPLLI